VSQYREKGRGPLRYDVGTRANPIAQYDWDQGRLEPIVNKDTEAVQSLLANHVLADNVAELQKLQENLPGGVAAVYRAKRAPTQ